MPYPVTADSFLSEKFLESYENIKPKNKGPLFEVVYLRTYSRWRPEINRRENWLETVQRVVEYNMKLGEVVSPESISEAEELFDRIFHLKLLPSGRSLWIGGTKGAEKHQEANFNCSFIAIDSLDCFCELFHLLLCGCGVGFSVIKEDIEKLPEMFSKQLAFDDYVPVPKEEREENSSYIVNGSTAIIYVGDSKKGWVDALSYFLASYTSSVITNLQFNFNSVRPEGERIITFGGRAPGPKGMIEMFKKVSVVLNKSPRISTVAAVDIANLIAKNVIVGGTRRSSQIALGDPDNEEFIDAKLPHNLSENAHRTMSNNTVQFKKKPGFPKLEQLFDNIMSNGEPGFMNLSSALKRRPNAKGLNPCLTAGTWINTTEGPRQIKDLVDTSFMAIVNNQIKPSAGFWSTGVKPVYRLKTKEGYTLNLTKDHKILTESGWKEAKDLVSGDEIVLSNVKRLDISWKGNGTFKEGWMLGSLVGDGCFDDKEAQLRYWGEDREFVSQQAFSYMKESLKVRSDCSANITKSPYIQVSSNALGSLARAYGIKHYEKVVVSKEIEESSSDFYAGYLRGLFDADGSPQGNIEKGRSIRLSQANYEFLVGIQRMLLRLGIKSTVYKTRKEAAFKKLPGGKGGLKDYFCKEVSELIISRDSMLQFEKMVGFSEPKKVKRLAEFTNVDNIRKLYTDKFICKFDSLQYLGEEEVFDCTVEDIHCFDANGIVAHNCGEILLDSRGFCNLSTVVITSHLKEGKLDKKDLLRSMQLATRIGVRQTNVTVSLPEWDRIQKRDRLTGVSFTGWMDAVDSLGWKYDNWEAVNTLIDMRKSANDEATSYAYKLRIPRPLLVTCIKPEGTLSQLPTVSSGLHRSYAPYFIRRIRVSSMDPVAKALVQLGMTGIPDPNKGERLIFEFPVKTEAKITANDESAMDQLNRYLIMQKHYTDHNSSCTLTIAKEELSEIVKKVHDEWDNIVACAWLPKWDMPYPLMPYEACSREEYNKRFAELPDLTNLDKLVNELELQEFEGELEEDPACASGACPIR